MRLARADERVVDGFDIGRLEVGLQIAHGTPRSVGEVCQRPSTRRGSKNPIRLDGTVEPLKDFEAVFLNERGAIGGFAKIDLVDGPSGTSIKVRE
ncbi:MAG: hypothetical protein K8M05_19805 [Deltaproteobacteria bacterium]|nr:hypothetical protein [Kofleriaceae bacterium]